MINLAFYYPGTTNMTMTPAQKKLKTISTLPSGSYEMLSTYKLLGLFKLTSKKGYLHVISRDGWSMCNITSDIDNHDQTLDIPYIHFWVSKPNCYLKMLGTRFKDQYVALTTQTTKLEYVLQLHDLLESVNTFKPIT